MGLYTAPTRAAAADLAESNPFSDSSERRNQWQAVERR